MEGAHICTVHVSAAYTAIHQMLEPPHRGPDQHVCTRDCVHAFAVNKRQRCCCCLPCCPAGWELERDVAASFMGDAALPAVITPFNKAAAIVAASVIDCIGAALYFVITLGLILLARRRAEDADTHTVTIHDYSVYVQKLPPDATSSELVDFFSQWGEVRGAKAGRNCRAWQPQHQCSQLACSSNNSSDAAAGACMP